MRRRPDWQGLAFCLCVALAWEVAARQELLPPRLFPALTSVLAQLAEGTAAGTLPMALAKTLACMGAGLLAATGMIPLGIWAGRSQRVWSTIGPTVEFLRSLPPALMALPAMLLLGIGDAPKIFAVFFAASFPILFSTMDGVRAIPPLFLDTARTLQVKPSAMLFEVILPAAAPGMFSGLKTALPMAFIVAMVSEMIGGADGIGHLLLRSQRSFDIPQMYAIILMVALTGGVLAQGLNIVEFSCLRWYSGWKSVCGQRCE